MATTTEIPVREVRYAGEMLPADEFGNGQIRVYDESSERYFIVDKRSLEQEARFDGFNHEQGIRSSLRVSEGVVHRIPPNTQALIYTSDGMSLGRCMLD